MPYPLNRKGPADSADVDSWAAVAHWTASEAAALLADWEPTQAGYLRDYDEDAIKIDRVRIAVERAIEAGKLAGQPDRIRPYDVVCWASDLPFGSDRLFWAVLAHEHRDELGRDAGKRDRVEAAELKSLQKENAELKRKLVAREQASAPQPPIASAGAEPDLGERERTTFLKIILGMAVKKYRYRINQNNGASGQISRDLEELGISVSDDTIREKLGEAGQKIGFDNQK